MSKLAFVTQTPIDIYAEVSRTRLAIEEVRLGMRLPDDATYRSPFAPAAPGVVHYRAPSSHDGIKLLSERRLLALMAETPTGQGSALHERIAIRAASGSLSPLRPYPRNDLVMLQPGDAVRFDGKHRVVDTIQVGWSSHDQSAISWEMAARGRVTVSFTDGVSVPGGAIRPHNASHLSAQAASKLRLQHVYPDAAKRLVDAARPRAQAHDWIETYKLASAARSALGAMLVETVTQRSGSIPRDPFVAQDHARNRALRVRAKDLTAEVGAMSNVMAFDDWKGCAKLVEALQGERTEVWGALRQMRRDNRMERLAVQQLANAPRY